MNSDDLARAQHLKHAKVITNIIPKAPFLHRLRQCAMSRSCLGLALALGFSVAALDSLEDANCPILGESFAAAGDDVGLHFLQLRGQNQSGSDGEEASSHDGCFHEVRKFMRFDAKLSLRQLQKIQLFTEALSAPKPLLP